LIKRSGAISEMVVCLLCKREALSLNTTTTKKKYSLLWCCAPVVPATLEDEIRRPVEPRSSTPTLDNAVRYQPSVLTTFYPIFPFLKVILT
jgi:hypothetical protein